MLTRGRCARGFRGIALGVLEYLLLAREAEAHNCHRGSIRNPRKRWFQMPLVAEYRALLEATQGLDALIGGSVVQGPSLMGAPIATCAGIVRAPASQVGNLASLPAP